MKKIEILGTGCPKCKQLSANAEQAATELGIEYELANWCNDDARNCGRRRGQSRRKSCARRKDQTVAPVAACGNRRMALQNRVK